MNIEEIFKNQIESGVTKGFFYVLERSDPLTLSILSHKDSLDTFPKLTYITHLSEGIPVFKEV